MSIYQGNPGDVKRPVWKVLKPGTIGRLVSGHGTGTPALTLEDFQRLRNLARETVSPDELESPGGQGSLR